MRLEEINANFRTSKISFSPHLFHQLLGLEVSHLTSLGFIFFISEMWDFLHCHLVLKFSMCYHFFHTITTIYNVLGFLSLFSAQFVSSTLMFPGYFLQFTSDRAFNSVTNYKIKCKFSRVTFMISYTITSILPSCLILFHTYLPLSHPTDSLYSHSIEIPKRHVLVSALHYIFTHVSHKNCPCKGWDHIIFFSLKPSSCSLFRTEDSASGTPYIVLL